MTARLFATMEDFYATLRAQGCGNEGIDIIKRVFQQNWVTTGGLALLTYENLKEYGLEYGGLRDAVLAALPK
jgi:hypothetical protein